MTTTYAGALRKVLIDAHIVPGEVAIDFASDNTQIPYITYNDSVSNSPALKGDARATFMNRDMQVNLWQSANDEDPQLVRDLIVTLNGAALVVDGEPFVPRVQISSVSRIADGMDTDLVQHVLTIGLVHSPFVF